MNTLINSQTFHTSSLTTTNIVNTKRFYTIYVQGGYVNTKLCSNKKGTIENSYNLIDIARLAQITNLPKGATLIVR